MLNRPWLAAPTLLRAAALVAMVAVPSLSAEAATAPIESDAPKGRAEGPTLAQGIAAMKRGSDYLAFAILQPFAEDGNRAAEANLASLHLRGRGTAKDPQAALRLYESAAAQGLTLAYGLLGAFYQQGEGVAPDPKLALDWYRRGAAAGDPGSLFGLGLMYHNGLGVAANLPQAAKWYRMAAMRGHARAKFMLGVMHYQGRGVPKDLVEAYKWFALAQAALPPGPDRDRSIKAANLIEASLPQEELDAARASAADWAPVN
jgi:TPR repeat protein